MSNEFTFHVNESQAKGLEFLKVEDGNAFIADALKAALVVKLTYERRKQDAESEEQYNLISDQLKALNMTLPESREQYKARNMAQIDDVLRELGYTKR